MPCPTLPIFPNRLSTDCSSLRVKLAFLTPGTGNYYCGVCMRDNSLAKQLMAIGHEVTMLPTYLPHFLDEEPASEDQPIFLRYQWYLNTSSLFFVTHPLGSTRLLTASGFFARRPQEAE